MIIRAVGRIARTRLKIGFIIEGELQQAVAAMQVQFMANIQSMVLDCLDADSQQIGDFFTGMILGNEFQDAAFRGGEVVNLGLA